MLLEILIVGMLGVAIFLLWRVSDGLTRMGKNQCDQATMVMQELELIRAGLFAITRVKDGEGWPEFDKLGQYIVKEYIGPARIVSTLRAEGKSPEQISDYLAAVRRLEKERDD